MFADSYAGAKTKGSQAAELLGDPTPRHESSTPAGPALMTDPGADAWPSHPLEKPLSVLLAVDPYVVGAARLDRRRMVTAASALQAARLVCTDFDVRLLGCAPCSASTTRLAVA